jgi:hypothetical protein
MGQFKMTQELIAPHELQCEITKRSIVRSHAVRARAQLTHERAKLAECKSAEQKLDEFNTEGREIHKCIQRTLDLQRGVPSMQELVRELLKIHWSRK